MCHCCAWGLFAIAQSRVKDHHAVFVLGLCHLSSLILCLLSGFMSVRSAFPSERTHRIWHAQRLLSRRPSVRGPKGVRRNGMALEFNMCATIPKKLEMKRCGFYKILRFACSASLFEGTPKAANAMFLAPCG